ncbi:MAG TPA: sensor histidine kinase [Actinomycetota bacterium]|jgi:signal transduction histidine kinase|nr:sensor histidine kinase [Actinomycetota bacterium]
MRSASEVAERPERGLFGIVPPGRPTDVAVAALTGVAQIGLTIGASRNQPSREPLDLLAYLLLAAGPVALLWRRRAPVWVLVAVTASNVLYFALGYPYGPAWLSLIVAIWTAVTAGARRAAWAIALLGLAAYFALAALLGRVHPATVPEIAAHLGWLLLVLVVAEVAMAGRQRRLAAERTRAEEARRRAGEERMRIARELHDVLAHNISLINVQAGVALHLMDEQPGQSRSALAAIKQASNDALGELRSVLDILRQGDEAPPRAPTPGLGQLDSLVAGAGATGLPVSAKVEGTPRPLPAGTDLAAFRIVQESLTNVTRHAGPASATVLVRYGTEDLTVQVDDDGKGVGPNGTGGRGIRGMRERVAALGGELTTGPRPGGGFRVLARLPLGDPARGDQP